MCRFSFPIFADQITISEQFQQTKNDIRNIQTWTSYTLYGIVIFTFLWPLFIFFFSIVKSTGNQWPDSLYLTQIKEKHYYATILPPMHLKPELNFCSAKKKGIQICQVFFSTVWTITLFSFNLACLTKLPSASCDFGWSLSLLQQKNSSKSPAKWKLKIFFYVKYYNLVYQDANLTWDVKTRVVI